MDTLQLNELLECSVCLERLEHNCKVLPCQHTFCLRCLKQIVASRKELRCPECRVLVTEDVDDLPTNILLVRILEGLKRQKELKKKEVDHEDNSNALAKENEEVGAATYSKEPCARALYDYEPKEQGDLVLKRGQNIQLLRQVDANWYEGKIDGQQGFLPANYVEVLVPLPNFEDCINQGPVARALYDFEDPEEKDLLSFKQGEIIQVIRRVDENWCEGRVDNVYGIFPVNFVEFNDAARSIIFFQNPEQLLSESHWDQAVQVRPTRRAKTTREVKRHTVHGGERQQLPKENGNTPSRHSVDVTCSERFDTYCNNELSSQSVNRNNNSEQTAGRQEDNSSDIPVFIPQDEDSSNLARVSANHSRQSSRESPTSSSHSRQNSDELGLESGNAQSSSDERSLTQVSNSSRQNGSEEKTITSSSKQSSEQTNQPSKSRHSSSSDADGSELYIALYNYKSQKEDEIDLVQGEKYHVIDKCRDGWYKGKSVKTHKSGVFPGNYVKLSRSTDALGAPQQASTSGVSTVNGQSSSSSSSIPSRRRSVPAPSSAQRSAPTVAPHQNSDLTDVSYNIVAPNERIPPQSQPPPPPAMRPSASGSASFFRKFSIGKKKEKGRPIMPPPPPYQRHPTSSYRQDGSNISLFGPSPNIPPPPYSSRSTAGQLSRNQSSRPSRPPSSSNRERCRVVVAYPPQSSSELELRVGDIVYVFKKHEDGWYRGTLERNGKTGSFPGSFVEKF